MDHFAFPQSRNKALKFKLKKAEALSPGLKAGGVTLSPGVTDESPSPQLGGKLREPQKLSTNETKKTTKKAL